MINFFRNKLFRIFLVLMVAGVVTAIVLFFSPGHRVVLEEYLRSSPATTYLYTDLDHDGKSEKLQIIMNNSSRKKTGLLVYTSSGKIIEQWNFRGVMYSSNNYFVGDMNGDGRDEVFLFSVKNDSLFLHCVDPLERRVLFSDRYIEKVKKLNEKYDYSLYEGFLYDGNGDGIREYYFPLMCGFARFPRGVYRYDPGRDTVIRSPAGCAPVYSLLHDDLDKDGVPEIFTSTMAPANCDTLTAYTDHYCWLMVFTPELTFRFPPYRFPKGPATTRTAVLKGKKEDLLCVLFQYRGTDNVNSSLILFDGRGHIRKKRNITIGMDDSGFELVQVGGSKKNIYLIENKGNIFSIDTSLVLKRVAHLPGLFYVRECQHLDIDGDGKTEHLLQGKNINEFVIARENFSSYLTVSLPAEYEHPHFSVVKRGGLAPLLFMDSDNYQYLFRYERSWVYRYWLMLFVLIGLASWLLLFMLEKVREYRRLKISDTQRKIYELQLKSFQNQLDPHFTFNAITSLGTLIYTEKKEEAYDYLVRFSSLIRKILESSDKITRTLKEEIEFVENYLDLQKYRFRNQFETRISVAKEIDLNVKVPRMIIETHVENALKHGLLHSDKKGLIEINISKDRQNLVIEITDNGVGREKAAEIKNNSTHLGLKVTEQFYMLINKYNRNKISRRIIDLYDENGMPAGTKVVIRIPQGIRYEI
jgi:two-component sensor histidine kinase